MDSNTGTVSRSAEGTHSPRGEAELERTQLAPEPLHSQYFHSISGYNSRVALEITFPFLNRKSDALSLGKIMRKEKAQRGI